VEDIDGKHLAAAWEQLEQALTAANKHFLQYNDGGRTAAFKQLTAVNQFVSSVSTQSLLQIPLVALTLALHYLDHGVVEPMLRPRANKARRGRRPEHELLKVRSAVAMSQLYQIGYKGGSTNCKGTNQVRLQDDPASNRQLARLFCEPAPPTRVGERFS
jgi:hypothetical protein